MTGAGQGADDATWRAAATAPRDGSHFYAANFDLSDSGFGMFSAARVPWQGVVHWWGHLGEEGFYLSSGDTGSPIRFTHWRPLLLLADGVVNALKRAAASIAAEQAGRGNMDSSDISRADDADHAALLREVEGLRTLVQRYASECGECGGTGTLDLTTGNTIFKTADFYPRCPDCADIRAALSPASGGV